MMTISNNCQPLMCNDKKSINSRIPFYLHKMGQNPSEILSHL